MIFENKTLPAVCCVIFIYLFLCCPALCAADSSKVAAGHDVFSWSQLPDLPNAVGVAGPFAGVYNDVLIVAGGANFPKKMPWDGGEKVWYDDIYVLDKAGEGKYQWSSGFKLDRPLAYGASLTTEQGIICIGGCDADKCYDEVFILKWDSQQRKVIKESLPSLPQPCASTSAAIIGDVIYVAGGQAEMKNPKPMNNFWSLDLSQKNAADGSEFKWLQLSPWPGQERIQTVLAVQSNGEDDCLYLYSGRNIYTGSMADLRKDAYQYNPKTKTWKEIADPPRNIVAGTAAPIGSSHVMLFGGVEGDLWNKNLNDKHPGLPKDILAYHTITDTWVQMGEVPESLVTTVAVPWGESIIFTSGEARPGVRSPKIWKAQIIKPPRKFGIINYLTLGGYLMILVMVGVYFSRKEKNTDDFFLAGKRIPWWAAGLSIFATGFSAISFMSIPAKVYATDWLYLLGIMSVIPVVIFTLYLFVPFVRKLEVTTAYEYLEKRFNLMVRLFGSLMFILFQLGRIAIVMLLPAFAIATVTGINVQVCILAMGLLCIIYTVLGGIEAVIWNDCIQVVVLTGGALAVVLFAANSVEGSFTTIFSAGQADHKFRMVNLTWDYTVASVWVLIIGNFLSNFPPYITDQAVIQRYLTTPDIKSAKRSLWFNACIITPLASLFFLMGTALYVFYKNNPALIDPTIKTDGIVPLFVVQQLPAGLCGLVIAGIFAAAMSSLDSSMHAITTAIINDFWRRFKPNLSDHSYLVLARWITGIIGVCGTSAAMILAVCDIPSLYDAFLTMLGLLSGGVAGIFLLGILTTRANGMGSFIGAIVSVILAFAAQRFTEMHFFLYGAVGLLSSMVVGYLVSLIIPARKQNLEGLTIYTIGKKVQ